MLLIYTETVKSYLCRLFSRPTEIDTVPYEWNSPVRSFEERTERRFRISYVGLHTIVLVHQYKYVCVSYNWNLKSRRLRWSGHVARMEQCRNAYKVLVGKPEGKRPLGKPRCRWKDNIKMDLREMCYNLGDWIALAEDRDRWRAYVRAVMNLGVS